MAGDTVTCYSGASFAERPRSFEWQGERYEVIEILGRWHAPDEMRFRVRSEGPQCFDLVYTESTDDWQVLPV